MPFKYVYFNDSDFACKCGCGKMPEPDLIAKVVLLRERYHKPLIVSSGARCMKHTLALRAQGIPAALGSAHIEGRAIDLQPVDGDIASFHYFVESQLVKLDLYMEDPQYTKTWAHIQTRKAQDRIFKP